MRAIRTHSRVPASTLDSVVCLRGGLLVVAGAAAGVLRALGDVMEAAWTGPAAGVLVQVRCSVLTDDGAAGLAVGGQHYFASICGGEETSDLAAVPVMTTTATTKQVYRA